jgi:FixJ family two-component response regulator
VNLHTAETHVFFVDDDIDVRTAYVRVARSAKLQASAFASVPEFIEAEIDDESACVVCDIHMPGMTGLELPGLLAEDGRQIPVIFITGDLSPSMRQAAEKLGPVGYLHKPVEADVLLGAIAGAIGSR